MRSSVSDIGRVKDKLIGENEMDEDTDGEAILKIKSTKTTSNIREAVFTVSP
jgi:hypothetical protein